MKARTERRGSRATRRSTPAFTKTQGEYLAFIHRYTALHGVPPAEAEIQAHFGTAPPSIHQMIVTLERRGLIARTPRTPRSIRVLVPPDDLPELRGDTRDVVASRSAERVDALIRLTERILTRLRDPTREHLAGVVRDEVAKAIREALVDELREGGLSPLEVRRAFERLAG